MRQIYYIMKAELQSLFYSPIAWLILVVFTVQCSVAFCDTLDSVTKAVAQGSKMPGLTGWFFSRDFQGIGVFNAGMRYLYIYFPLLTMGLFSRELASGSIKLLDSSPVSTTQVVLGKFFSMLVYAFVLLGVLMIFVIFGGLSIDNFVYTRIWVTFLGMFLTMATYSAIGLFMSSLTRYPVVAAIGSFVVFIILERIGSYGQSWDGIREITTWLSFSGRIKTIMDGLLTSQNIIYFTGITVLFLCFTVLKLWLGHYHYPLWRKASYYIGILLVIILLGWTSDRPALRCYFDATENEMNTITWESREIIEALKDKGKLTITTYVNLMDPYRNLALPSNISRDKSGFDKYVRFKPDIDFKYVYYYAPTDKPHKMQKMKPNLTFDETAKEIARLCRVNFSIFKTKEEIDQIVDLAPEHYRFVRFFELNGQRSALRIFDDIPPLPNDQEYMATFKRLMGGMPQIGVVKGHGERSIHDGSHGGYERVATSIFNRYSWLNQGIDGVEVELGEPVPESISILLIADPKRAYAAAELANLDAYLARGGNLILLVEPESHAVTQSLLDRFHVRLMEGCLAEKPTIELANVVCSHFTPEGMALFHGRHYPFGLPRLAMNGAAAFEVTGQSDFKIVSMMSSDPQTWNKIGKVDWIMGPIEPDAANGEFVRAYSTVLGLTRMVGEREQRIFIAGDADWMSNKELVQGRQGFRGHSPAALNWVLSDWMTYGQAPIYLSRPAVSDTRISTTQEGAFWVRMLFVWGISLILAVCGATICIRRNRH